MKKHIYYIIALTAFLITGCQNDPIVYSGPDFVSFDTKSINRTIKVGEDGIVEIKAGVTKTSKEDRTFNIAVDAANTTAVEGTDYSFVTQKITIPAGEYVGVVKIKGNYDNLTPEGVKLTLKLEGGETTLQAGTTTSVTINLTRFFEITMDWLTGSWLAQDTQDGENDGDPYEMTIEHINADTIAIKSLWGTPSKIKGVVDYANAQIQIPAGQYMYTHETAGPIFIFNVVGSSLSLKPIVCDINFRGITTGSYGLLNADYSGWFPYVTYMEKIE